MSFRDSLVLRRGGPWRMSAGLAAVMSLAACSGEGTAVRDGRTPGPAAGGSGSTIVTVGDWRAPEAAPPESPVAQFGQLRVEGSALLDQAGNPVQLKGVSTMWLNWEQNYAGSKAGLQWMRDNWGLRVVRAAMGIEPTGAFLTNPGPMISNVRNVVQNAIDSGVYVIIDWHDHNGQLHQDQAVEFFSQIAAEFGAYPNVLYETYNEPLQVSWSNVVKPYHEAVSAAIREQDPDNVIIMGTPVWSQAVDEAAADPVAGTNLMYTVHFYSCTHRAGQRAQAQRALDRGVAIFVTEWGATVANGGTDPNGEVCVAEAQLWHDLMDTAGISWTAWKLDDCADLSCLFRPGAPRDGGWTDQHLNGHGPFVRDRMLER
jgi:endoglucanase